VSFLISFEELHDVYRKKPRTVSKMNFFMLGLVSLDKATKQKTVNERSFVKMNLTVLESYVLNLELFEKKELKKKTKNS
jgi:hypothetical protein